MEVLSPQRQTKAVGKYVDGELQGPWEWWRELPRHISVVHGKQ